MTSLKTIDLDAWPRREHYAHYRHRVPCTYSATVELDLTETVAALRDAGRKSYPAQIWALTSVVNRHSEFRMALDQAGEPAVWDSVHPSFTVFNPQLETFACVWTPFDTDFGRFHDAAAEVVAEHKSATSFFPQLDLPANVFDVSSLPWMHFTGFNLQIKDGWEHLLPIFTLGRYRESNGRTLMPLSVQIHHAAADGFHTARLVQELQEMFSVPEWVR